jgi:hypothetical protein
MIKPASISWQTLLKITRDPSSYNGDHWTPTLKRPRIVFDIGKPSADEQMLLWQNLSGGQTIG